MKSLLVWTAILGLAAALLPGREKTAADITDTELTALLGDEVPVSESETLPSTSSDDVEKCGTKGETMLVRSEYEEEVEQADVGEFRWTVAIYDKSNNSYVCSGSLIHPRVVLTVGHWFMHRGRWSVRAGDWQLSSNKEPAAPVTVDVKEVVVHSQINAPITNDIALMFLEKPIPVDVHIGTICLPPAGSATRPGVTCTATGWGLNKYNGTLQDIIKMANLPIVSHEDCKKMYKRLRYNLNPHKTTLCAGGVKNVDMCERDGGGPLVCAYENNPKQYYQAGLVTAGAGCGLEIPGLYTDVAELRSWIDQHVLARGYSTSTYTA